MNANLEENIKRSSSTDKLERFCDRLNMAMKGESVYAFAKRTGFNESLIRKYLSGASMPIIDKAGQLAQAVKVDLTWLATGEGEMRPSQKPKGDLRTSSGSANLRDPSPQSAALSLSDQAHSDETEAVWDDFALVPVYDVQASAGHGSHVEAELQTGQLAFKKAWLREKGLKIGHLAIITAKGDSMDPTICDRDTLLVDTRVDKIIDDSIYIVQADHHLIVKRLQQAFDGSVSIISDNPRYKEQTLTSEQAKTLKIAGRVCWYGHEI
ncbi:MULTISPECIES: S24 family peptidase [Methylobacter]